MPKVSRISILAMAAVAPAIALTAGAGAANAAPPNTGGGIVACAFTNHNPNLPAISQVAQVYDSSTRSDVHTPVVSSYPLSVVGYTQTISVDWRNATTRKSGTARTTAHRVRLLSSDVWLPRIHTGAGHLTFTVHITNRSQINPASVTRAACTYRLWT